MLKNVFLEKPGINRLFFPHCKQISVLLLNMPVVPACEQPGREKSSSRAGALQLLHRWGVSGGLPLCEPLQFTNPGENWDGKAALGSDRRTLVAADGQTSWSGSSGRATAKAEGDTARRHPPTHAVGGSGGTKWRMWAATTRPEQLTRLERF